MNQRRVLLGVFAHPDDESFACGGTLARYAAEGADVHIIIATDGVAGSVEQSSGIESGSSLSQARAARAVECGSRVASNHDLVAALSG